MKKVGEFLLKLASSEQSTLEINRNTIWFGFYWADCDCIFLYTLVCISADFSSNDIMPHQNIINEHVCIDDANEFRAINLSKLIAIVREQLNNLEKTIS